MSAIANRSPKRIGEASCINLQHLQISGHIQVCTVPDISACRHNGALFCVVTADVKWTTPRTQCRPHCSLRRYLTQQLPFTNLSKHGPRHVDHVMPFFSIVDRLAKPQQCLSCSCSGLSRQPHLSCRRCTWARPVSATTGPRF